ncbi:thiolase domain-containing protein [Rhabdothermincola sp.]|uniref:thiolase domain-containing protein n=1 Tax=Rhabdothermincola sp. TaxID=2820405 RepID=UPI002FE200FA
MRDVAIISFAQTAHQRAVSHINETEMLMPLLGEALRGAGISKDRVDFVCSGSSDYLAGQPFSFVMTLDAFGPWPPISESHVDMDGAWALYEAWVKMQMGHIDVALIYAYGKSSPGEIRRVLSRQLDPYYLGPLWVDSVSLAALQARCGLEAGAFTVEEMAEVAAASRRQAQSNPFAQLAGDVDASTLLQQDEFVAPLRKHDCPPITDGAAVVVLAAGDVARELCDRPAWIRGIDHRIEPHALGVRDLTRSVSTEQAAARAGVGDGKVDVAELHAPFTHQELILREALALDDAVAVNPSGGALCANPIMAAGLIRFGEAASRIWRGEADRAVAHATSGPCLQQNLVCVLEGA